MGMTGQELSKLVESGQLMSTDFLPKFLNQMQSFVNENGMLEASLKKVAAEQGRFNMRLVEAIDIGYQSGRSGFFGFFYNLRKIIEENTQTFEVFGAIFGGGLKFISGVIKNTVSPVVGVLGASLNTLRKAFKEALDPENTWKQLNIIEAAFRGAAWAALYLNLATLYVRKGLTDLAKWLGEDSEGASTFAKQIVSIVTGILGVVAGLKMLRFMFNWAFLGPMKLVYGIARKLFGLFGMKLPDMSRKVGSVTSKTTSTSSRIAGAVSKAAPIASRFAGPLAVGGMLWEASNRLPDLFRSSGPDLNRLTDTEARMLAGNKSIIQNNNIQVTGDDPVTIGREVARQLQQQHILAMEAE